MQQVIHFKYLQNQVQKFCISIERRARRKILIQEAGGDTKNEEDKVLPQKGWRGV